MAKITQQQLVGLLSKLTPQTFVASQALKGVGKAKDIATEKFGYDFLGLGLRLLLFFAVAFLIEAYFKSKIAINEIINDPDRQVGIISGLFGLTGIVFNFLYQSFQQDKPDEPAPTPITSDFFNNEALKAVFSEEGYHGFHYWDIIKIIALLLVVMEWRRFTAMTKATGGQVQPLTHGLFILFIVGLGLSIIPQLVSKIKHSYINPQAMT